MTVKKRTKTEFRIARLIYFDVCFFFLFTKTVHAYIDPSVMTYAIQAIAGIAIALGTFVNFYWRRIRKKVGWNGFSFRKTEQIETDELYYKDPVSGNTYSPQIEIYEKEKSEEEEKKSILSEFWQEYRNALILSAAISYLVMMFSPLDLYFNNVNDFWFDFGVVIPLLLKLFALTFLIGAVIFAICWLLFEELFHVAYIGAFAAFLCAYIQGNYLSGKLPAIDGTAVDWSLYHVQMLQSRYLWMLLPAAVLLLARFVKMKKFYRITKYISILIVAMLSVSLVFACVKNNGLQSKNYRISTTEHLYEMSEKQNFVILVVDALDARYFEKIIEEYPEYKETFRDFTFFPDTVGAYTFTNYALPQLLTGAWMENQTDYQTYVTEAMEEAPIFKELEEKGFRMGLYETKLLYDSDNIYKFENYIKGNVSFGSMKTFLSEELPLFFFKYAPYQLKRYFEPDLQYFYHTMHVNNDVTVFSDLNPDFYESILNAEVVTTGDKCFKFIHFEGAHTPYRYNKDVVPIPESEGSYEQNVLCSITIMNAYIQVLKDAGVFDNTAIIMMGDHGLNFDNNEYWGRQNPTLLIKGISEKHDFSISEAPISYADLQEAYHRLISGMPAEACFDAKTGDSRMRRYMHYIREEKITEYYQEGYASDTDTLIPSGNVYERTIDYLAEFHNN